MLIDQHRAHIRVLFDRYMSQICQKQGVSQGMLFPEIIQLPASEAAVLESLSDDLAAVGFDLSLWEEAAMLSTAFPPVSRG